MVLLATLPDPETIRRTAREVVERPDFQLGPESKVDRVIFSVLRRLLDALWDVFRWLFKLVEGLPEWMQYIVVWGMILALVAILAHLVYSVATLFLGAKRGNLTSIKLGSMVADPVVLERQAEAAAEQGDCSQGVRLLFRACLLRLEQAESRKYRGGVTNREVLRRHRNSAVYEPMKLFVETLEIKWYGMGECSPADYAACKAAHAELVRSAKGAAGVQHA